MTHGFVSLPSPLRWHQHQMAQWMDVEERVARLTAVVKMLEPARFGARYEGCGPAR
ncbi:hypothetical protein NKI41_32485 [Mesorhizobium sp. M0601]|uniref:hypothetical protein n=1 Tax=Mesorhizobium sp. M0601 TaxID=2956969 RepID=UPI00333D287D